MQRQPGKPTLEEELERALTAAGAISPDNAGDFFKVMLLGAQGREGWERAGGGFDDTKG
jgi:tRNA U38,U39,U40 pseudouridine synthase TruA